MRSWPATTIRGPGCRVGGMLLVAMLVAVPVSVAVGPKPKPLPPGPPRLFAGHTSQGRQIRVVMTRTRVLRVAFRYRARCSLHGRAFLRATLEGVRIRRGRFGAHQLARDGAFLAVLRGRRGTRRASGTVRVRTRFAPRREGSTILHYQAGGPIHCDSGTLRFSVALSG